MLLRRNFNLLQITGSYWLERLLQVVNLLLQRLAPIAHCKFSRVQRMKVLGHCLYVRSAGWDCTPGLDLLMKLLRLAVLPRSLAINVAVASSRQALF